MTAPAARTTSVLLVEDHAVVRAGLAQLIATTADLAVVATASSGEEATALAARHRPDVALMDLSLPGIDGIEATRQVRAASPGTAVVVLTALMDRQRILGAVDAGAVGYLLKNEEPEAIFGALRAAARGEIAMSSPVMRVVDEAREGEAPLTARERQVLELVAAGLPNKVIAYRLGIREKTVKAHLTSVYQRIGVHDRMQAALWARGALS